jgi:hypothetical protein
VTAQPAAQLLARAPRCAVEICFHRRVPNLRGVLDVLGDRSDTYHTSIAAIEQKNRYKK